MGWSILLCPIVAFFALSEQAKIVTLAYTHEPIFCHALFVKSINITDFTANKDGCLRHENHDFCCRTDWRVSRNLDTINAWSQNRLAGIGGVHLYERFCIRHAPYRYLSPLNNFASRGKPKILCSYRGSKPIFVGWINTQSQPLRP